MFGGPLLGAPAAPVAVGGGAAGATWNPNNDFELPQGPGDSVSSLAWSPAANHLVAGCWDKSVRLWDITPQPTFKAAIQLDQPVLSTAWADDGTRVFAAGCDGKLRMWNIMANQTFIVGQHDMPIKTALWSSTLNLAITGSWDKTLRFWDTRTPTINSLPVGDKVYSMDTSSYALVVGTADRMVHVYDTRSLPNAVSKAASQLRMQTRVVSLFHDASGYAIGSIEGRCGVTYFSDFNKGNQPAKSFAFKCHRQNEGQPPCQVFALNDIHFNKAHGTFVTAGADGVLCYWDIENRQRLKIFNRSSFPITSSRFNRDGSILAYACGYDWHKGVEHFQQGAHILLHQVTDEIRPKPKAGQKKK